MLLMSLVILKKGGCIEFLFGLIKRIDQKKKQLLVLQTMCSQKRGISKKTLSLSVLSHLDCPIDTQHQLYGFAKREGGKKGGKCSYQALR